MESITNSQDDFLIDGLSFKLPSGASYVTDRKTSTYFAVGSNIYTPVNGVKLVKFQLNGDDGNWLDPRSVIFQFDITNTDTDAVGANTKVLRPLGGPHLFFRRLRVLAGGQVVEDIQDFNRYQEMVMSLMNNNVRENNDIQGFGVRWDLPSVVDAAGYTADTIDTLYPGIQKAETRTVNFRPLCGILNQSKFLPLKYMGPLIFEFELADTNDAIITPASSAIFTATNTTSNWQISNCCVKCDICTLDNALNNEYTAHLLSGKALPIEYSTYISQQTSIASGTTNTQQFSVQVIRAVSRLQKAFVTFYDSAYAGSPFYKPSVVFHHPMAFTGNAGRYNPIQDLTLQLQIGAKLLPEYPSTNIAEQFFMLKKALNLPDFHQHSIGIRYKNFYKDKFIFCVSFEKIPDADWTGINTKAGQILMINGKAPKMPNTQTIGTTMYTVLEAQQILEIRDVGCTVYD